jgi:hypothetical protein
MDIKKFAFRDLNTTNLSSNVTLGEYLATSHLMDMEGERNDLEKEGKQAKEERSEKDLTNYILKEEAEKLLNGAFEQGRQEGLKFIHDQLKEREVQALQQNNLILEKIDATLSSLQFNDSQEVFAENLEHIKILTLNIASKLASSALENNFVNLIDEVIKKYMAELKSHKKIILKINPAFSDLQDQLNSAFSKILNAEFEILFEESLGRYDIEIGWEDGFIKRSFEEITKQVEELLLKSSFKS